MAYDNKPMKIYPEKVILEYLVRYVSDDYEYKTNGKGHWINIPSPFYPDKRRRLGFNLDNGIVFDFKLQRGMDFETFVVRYNKEVLDDEKFNKMKAQNILFRLRSEMRTKYGGGLSGMSITPRKIEEDKAENLPELKDADVPVGLETFDKDKIMRNPMGRKAVIYLQKREFTSSLIEKYNLKYIDHELCPICKGERNIDGKKCWYCKGWGKNKYHGRIYVPTYENGKLVYFQARDYIDRDPKWKYMNPSAPRRQVVYFYDRLPENERLFGAEGPFDSMYLDKYPCTALMGNKTSRAFVQKILWKKPKQFIFIPDFDKKMNTRKQILENLTYNINKFKEEASYPIELGVYNWFALTDAKDLNAGGINYVDDDLIIFPNKEKFKFKEMVREILNRPE